MVAAIHRHKVALILGITMAILIAGLTSGVLSDRAEPLLLILNLPAFIIAMVATGSVHGPNHVVFALASGLQWAGIGEGLARWRRWLGKPA